MNRAEFEEDQDRLRRIAMRLLSLAALAERVSALPYAIRFLVLWILRRAEAIAREFVEEEASGPLVLPEAAILGTGGDSSEGALRLAYCFRVLAAVIHSWLAYGEVDGRNPFAGEPDRHIAQQALVMTWRRFRMEMPGAIAAACAAGYRHVVMRRTLTSKSLLEPGWKSNRRFRPPARAQRGRAVRPVRTAFA